MPKKCIKYLSNVCCVPGAGTVGTGAVLGMWLLGTERKANTAVFPQYLFHFLLPPAKAVIILLKEKELPYRLVAFLYLKIMLKFQLLHTVIQQ